MLTLAILGAILGTFSKDFCLRTHEAPERTRCRNLPWYEALLCFWHPYRQRSSAHCWTSCIFQNISFFLISFLVSSMIHSFSAWFSSLLILVAQMAVRWQLILLEHPCSLEGWIAKYCNKEIQVIIKHIALLASFSMTQWTSCGQVNSRTLELRQSYGLFFRITLCTLQRHIL